MLTTTPCTFVVQASENKEKKKKKKNITNLNNTSQVPPVKTSNNKNTFITAKITANDYL